MGSHGYFLQLQGASREVVDALAQANFEAAPVTEAERQLLRFAALLTREPAKVTDPDVQRLREAGWTDDQIAEAVYITALFAFFNRIAEAFGLEDPGWLKMGASAPIPTHSHKSKPDPGREASS